MKTTAQITKTVRDTTGLIVDEKEMQSQQVNFGVGPREAVIHQIIWKVKVRSAESHFISHGRCVKVLHRTKYGLTFEHNVLPMGQKPDAPSSGAKR